jgi:hypothetical protein
MGYTALCLPVDLDKVILNLTGDVSEGLKHTLNVAKFTNEKYCFLWDFEYFLARLMCIRKFVPCIVTCMSDCRRGLDW